MTKPLQEMQPEERYLLQQSCRHQMIAKLLADIAADMVVCQMEGWNTMEYIEQIEANMQHFISTKQLKNGNNNTHIR